MREREVMCRAQGESVCESEKAKEGGGLARLSDDARVLDGVEA